MESGETDVRYRESVTQRVHKWQPCKPALHFDVGIGIIKCETANPREKKGWSPVRKASKIWVALPDKLVSELDTLAEGAGLSRDDLLCRAVEAFVHKSTYVQLCATMAEGYRDMARLNLALAIDDEDSFTDWPEYEYTDSEDHPSGGA